MSLRRRVEVFATKRNIDHPDARWYQLIMIESTRKMLDRAIVAHVAETCLCMHTQRAARALARLFDNTLRPFGLTNGQFSLLMALNRPEPPSVGELAPFLAMDRTSVTAALKPLERLGLVRIIVHKSDRRSHLIEITANGVALLAAALPAWRETHALLDAALAGDAPNRLRADLRGVSSAVSKLSSSPPRVAVRRRSALSRKAGCLPGAQRP
jgi:DNA-binding MarR family transcriptional regulator